VLHPRFFQLTLEEDLHGGRNPKENAEWLDTNMNTKKKEETPLNTRYTSDVGAKQKETERTDLECNNVLGFLLAREIDVAKFSPSQRLSELKIGELRDWDGRRDRVWNPNGE
jgi:hypothetical protein